MALILGEEGFLLARGLLHDDAIPAAEAALLDVAKRFLCAHTHQKLDELRGCLWSNGREGVRLLYNIGKRLPAIHRLAAHPALIEQLKAAGMTYPVLVDVNFRIDAVGDEKYLFGWHQDYWFSVCSPAAVVAWIPLSFIDDAVGGVELVGRDQTEGRILRTRPGNEYRSYSDAVLIDEDVSGFPTQHFGMNPGDVLFFRFDVLHRSLPLTDPSRARWTIQARFADLNDQEFRSAEFRPGQVKVDDVPFLRSKTHVE